MVQTVSPSAVNPITKGQIGKLYDLLADALVKSGLSSEQTQEVLETQGVPFAAELVAVIRKRVEAISNVIVRHVKVNRNRSPQEVIKATGRTPYLTDNVVATMPKGEGDEADVYFFKLGRYVNDADLDKEFELRGLKPVDPYSLAAVNEDDPAFADDHPNATHWKDANGEWCYAAFSEWYAYRSVLVDRTDGDWLDCWWFAGLRK